MTVCIGALAEKRKKLVLVSDKMITANIPMPYQFEKPDVQKIFDILPNIKVLMAGNALFAYEIIEATKKRIEKEKAEGKEIHSVEEVTEAVRQSFQEFRRIKVIQTTLEPRGMNLQLYVANQKNLMPGVVQEVENALINFNIGVELIVAGVNEDGNCHLYSINHPGISACHDTIGYACVGSGAPHAMYSLIASDYTKDKLIAEVEKFVAEAKKRSEVAPGVGKETEKILLPAA